MPVETDRSKTRFSSATTALLNYTGSLGFGEEMVEAFVGQAGTLEVAKCYDSSKHLVEEGYASEVQGSRSYLMAAMVDYIIGHHLSFHVS
jgi:hypothetical protein